MNIRVKHLPPLTEEEQRDALFNLMLCFRNEPEEYSINQYIDEVMKISKNEERIKYIDIETENITMPMCGPSVVTLTYEEYKETKAKVEGTNKV